MSEDPNKVQPEAVYVEAKEIPEAQHAVAEGVQVDHNGIHVGAWKVPLFSCFDDVVPNCKYKVYCVRVYELTFNLFRSNVVLLSLCVHGSNCCPIGMVRLHDFPHRLGCALLHRIRINRFLPCAVLYAYEDARTFKN